MAAGTEIAASLEDDLSKAPSAAATRARRLAPWLIASLALIPALSMLVFVRSGSLMQFNDYWDVLPKVTNPDGSFAPRGIFEYQNEHPFAVPSVIYALNARVTGGSNVDLGTLVWVVVAAQVAVLTWALPRRVAAGPIQRALFAVVAAALLFATRGVHNFGFGMSGIAWLTANLFAILAIVVFWPRQPLLAFPAAALASLSYGTGLMVWPALIVLSVLERRSRRTTGLVVAATIGAAGLYLLGYEQPEQIPTTGRTAVETARVATQVLGSPFSDSTETASILGTVVLCAAAFAVWQAWQQGLLAELAPWIGLLVYALFAAGLIAFSRAALSDQLGASSRYVSIGALVWLLTLVLLVAVLGTRPLLIVGLAVASIAAYVGGSQAVQQVRQRQLYSDELAITLRLGAEAQPDPFFTAAAAPLLPVLDHYPFNGDFDFDCGYLDQRLNRSELGTTATGDREGVRGHLDTFLPAHYPSTVRVEGWATSDVGDIDCILVIDEQRDVVGAGIRAAGRPDVQAQGFKSSAGFIGPAIRLPPDSSYRAVVVTSDDQLVVVDGELTIDDAS